MSDEKPADAEQPLREALQERADGGKDGRAVREAGERFVEKETEALRRLLLPSVGLMVTRQRRGESPEGRQRTGN